MKLFCDNDNIGLTHNTSLNKLINKYKWFSNPKYEIEKFSFANIQKSSFGVTFGNFQIVVVSGEVFNELIHDQAALRVYDSSYQSKGILALELEFLGACPIRIVHNPLIDEIKALVLEYDIKELRKDKFNLNKPSRILEIHLNS